MKPASALASRATLEQAHDLVDDFDWTLNEECFEYDECTEIENSGGPGADGKSHPGLQLFVEKDKAVWVAEYKDFSGSAWNAICEVSRTQKFNTTRFKLGLPSDGRRMPCPTSSPTAW